MIQLQSAISSTQLLSSADGEFQAGNFIEATNRYAALLAELERAQETNELAAVLQKLADSQYASGDFTRAQRSYERLLDRDQSLSARDKIFILLKLAKSCDRCGDQAKAETMFDQAYLLAKLFLAASHFLRKTVADSYAAWLRGNGKSPLVLSILESELGFVQPMDIREPNPENETVNETAQSPKQRSNQRPCEEDFAGIRSKLANANKGARPAPRKDLKPSKNKGVKTIEQRVAERRFLTKIEGEAKGNLRTLLKNAVTDGKSVQSTTFEVFGALGREISSRFSLHSIASALPPWEVLDSENERLCSEAASLLMEVQDPLQEPAKVLDVLEPQIDESLRSKLKSVPQAAMRKSQRSFSVNLKEPIINNRQTIVQMKWQTRTSSLGRGTLVANI